jgi:hypothetical protein
MLRRTRRVLFLLLALLVSTHIGVEGVRAQDDDIVPAHQFLIRNKSRADVIFSLRKGWGPWDDYRLRPGEDHLYEDKDQVWFSPAGQDPIHCEVKLGQRYKFTFDGGRWDFVMIDPDQVGGFAAARGKEEPCGRRRRPWSVSALPAAGVSARAAGSDCPRPARACLRDRLDPHRLVPAVWLVAVEEFDRLAGVRSAAPPHDGMSK